MPLLNYTLHKIGVLYTINGYHTVAAENTRLGVSARKMSITAWLPCTSFQPRRLKMTENVRAPATLEPFTRQVCNSNIDFS
jgi:hypothetical protein